MKMKIAGIALLFLVVLFSYVGWRTPSLSENHGKMDTHLYLSDGAMQPMNNGRLKKCPSNWWNG
jgi:hypothetical protein